MRKCSAFLTNAAGNYIGFVGGRESACKHIDECLCNIAAAEMTRTGMATRRCSLNLRSAWARAQNTTASRTASPTSTPTPENGGASTRQLLCRPTTLTGTIIWYAIECVKIPCTQHPLCLNTWWFICFNNVRNRRGLCRYKFPFHKLSLLTFVLFLYCIYAVMLHRNSSI